MSGGTRTARYDGFKARLGSSTGQEIATAVEKMEQHASTIANKRISMLVLADLYEDNAIYLEKFGMARVVSVAPATLAGNQTNLALANFRKADEEHVSVENAIHEVKMAFLEQFDAESQELLKIDGESKVITAYSLKQLAEQAIGVFGVYQEAELDMIRGSLRNAPQDQKEAVAIHFSRNNKSSRY